ncbi:hypothetical protein AAF302_000717 [Pluralibacter gergoviae]
MGSVTVIKSCDTELLLSEYGVVIPSDKRDFELTFTDMDINTMSVIDPLTNEVVTAHEVMFSVKCDNHIRGGYYTKIITGFKDSSSEDIFKEARNLISK